MTSTPSARRAIARNWSGSVRWTPAQIVRPRTEQDIVDALASARRSRRRLRVIGGGHSFTALAATDGVSMSLDGYQGVVSADPVTGLVTLRGGTRLWAIADLLAPHGLALETMGDIDRQSISGALQTGTHGTGAAYTGFAGTVRALRIALPDGSVVDADSETNSDLFEAARLGLGVIGVICEVTIQCVPRYRLSLEEETVPLAPTVAGFLETSAAADHQEFFWFPGTERATLRTSARVAQEEARLRPHRALEILQQEVLGNGAFEVLCRAATLAPGITPAVNALTSRLFAGSAVCDDSPSVYAAPRRVRFHESEWAVPADRIEEAFAAVRRRIEADRIPITFPLEIRRLGADDVWMSPASGRDTVYIAAHRYHRQDQVPFLVGIQEALRPFDARPHWGKQHWLGPEDLRRLYPRFDDFLEVRRQADPDGVLLTPYLRDLLGV